MSCWTSQVVILKVVITVVLILQVCHRKGPQSNEELNWVVQMQEQPTFSTLVVTPQYLCTSVLDFALVYGAIWSGKGGSSILLYLRFLQKHPRVPDERLFKITLLILAVTCYSIKICNAL